MSLLGRSPIVQIGLWMKDLAAARDFYERTLGLKLMFAAPQMCLFQVGAVRLLMGHAPPGTPSGNSVVYFSAEDLDSVHEALVAAGVKILRAPHMIAELPHADLWMCEFLDPEGNVLAVQSERPANRTAVS
jgi:predicted enzyme related to lactoylglutathione lyase